MNIYILNQKTLEKEIEIASYVYSLTIMYPLEVISKNRKSVNFLLPLPNMNFGDCISCLN